MQPSIGILVPEFNELSRRPRFFDSQLRYFQTLSKQYIVTLIDDASSDGSWERIVSRAALDAPRFRASRMEQNGRKVYAIKRGLEICDSDYVLLTDFDSRLATPQGIPAAIGRLEADAHLAALSLRVVPDGHSIFSKLQDIEYGIGRRIFAGYLTSGGKLRCVPGAGGIWKRSVLLDVLKEHSGRHNGDDMEATFIAMRKGYRVQYDDSVTVETAVPQSIRDFFIQRKRWELGVLETYEKERTFLFDQVKKLKRFGHLAILDAYYWLSILTFPLLLAEAIGHTDDFLIYAAFQSALTATVVLLSMTELEDKRELALLPLLPFYQVLAAVPRLAAMYEFLKQHLLLSGVPLARRAVRLLSRGHPTTSMVKMKSWIFFYMRAERCFWSFLV